MISSSKILPTLLFVFFSIFIPCAASAACTVEILTPIHDCAPAHSVFKFTDNSGKTITSHSIDFGDGSTSSDTIIVFTHTYPKAGQYKVSVSVTFSDGSTCTARLSQTLIIYDHPTAIINLPSGFGTGSTQCFQNGGKLNKFCFSESSLKGSSGAPATDYFWNFGDGNTSVDSMPCHTYHVDGIYSVSLKVTDSNGCTNKETTMNGVKVLKDFKAIFVSNNNFGCNSIEVNFKNTTDTGGIEMREFVWDFGDGSPLDTINYNPTHIYGPGAYEPKLTVFNSKGCSDTYSTLIRVAKFEIKTFFTDTVCWSDAHNKGIEFAAEQQPNVVFWQWDFGDPASGTSNIANFAWTANHKFMGGPGNYKVKFTTKNSNPLCASNGVLDTCMYVHIKGPMAQINLPSPDFPANNFVPANIMPKTEFSAIANSANSCIGQQTISYATFIKAAAATRHVSYKYCNADTLAKTVSTATDCYGGNGMNYISSISLKPTDSVVSVYKDSFETKTTWSKGQSIPSGPVYYPSSGTMNANNMADTNLASCKLPNLVHFTNNSVKYRLQIQLDDNTYKNVLDPAHSFKDTCRWKNYPMASDSLIYFWKFNDPSGKPCTSSTSNKDWDCNFSSLTAPYHNYKGKTGMPAGGCQSATLTVTDNVMKCADSTTIQLKQGPPSAYWDRTAYCKMTWDMQSSQLAPKGIAGSTPLIGFQLTRQPSACAGSNTHFRIDFSQTLPQCQANHWWVIFDSAHVVKYKKCNTKDSIIDYGFTGKGLGGYTPGKNNYPAGGPDSYWQNAPWNGNYWYEKGDTGCKTIGIVLQNGTCYDTAWYHDYICFTRLDPYFNIYKVDPPVGAPVNIYTIQDWSSDVSSHGHICQTGLGDKNGNAGVKIYLYPHNVYQKDITSFRYLVQRRNFYNNPDYTSNDWYYRLPFWPDSAILDPFTSWNDTVSQIDHKVYNLQTHNAYIILNQNGAPIHSELNDFQFTKSEIDSLAARKHVNIPLTDARTRKLATDCGKPYITVYVSKIPVPNGGNQILNLAGPGAVDSLTLPYPGFYTITSTAANLQGCVESQQYNLIYGHFATFNANNDSIICLGQKANFNYYVRYWSTNCPMPAGGTPAPQGCLNGYDEDPDGNIPNTVDFAPWDSVSPYKYRLNITGGKFQKPAGYQDETLWWNFGDDKFFNRIPNGSKISHVYTKPGVYTVSMRTIDWRGCAVTTVRKNLIKVIQPVSDFVLTDPKDSLSNCPPKTVTLTPKVKLLGASYSEKIVKNGVVIDSVYTVDSISALIWSPGDGTTITRKTADNVTYDYVKGDSFDVGLTVKSNHGCSATTVKKKFIKIAGTMPNAHWSIKTDGKGGVTFLPDDLKNKIYLWNFGGNNNIGVVAPVFYFNSEGFYKVRMITTNEYGCTNEFDSTIFVKIHTGGINDKDGPLATLNIFPNPFQASTSIEYEFEKPENVKIEIFDVTGRQIALIQNQLQAPGKYHLDISAAKYHLYPGMYLFKFTTNEGYVSKRMICN